MNQPQPLSINLDFQGSLVCQIPMDAVEVELKIKTKWGKFTLHTDLQEQKNTGHGRKLVIARSILEGDNPTMTEQANPT